MCEKYGGRHEIQVDQGLQQHTGRRAQERADTGIHQRCGNRCRDCGQQGGEAEARRDYLCRLPEDSGVLENIHTLRLPGNDLRTELRGDESRPAPHPDDSRADAHRSEAG